MSLTFNPANHTYAFDGQPVPGVTSILEPLSNFGFVDPETMAAASAFGTAVHRACELADLGDLNEFALDPSLVPYLEAWRRFSVDYAVEWELIEAKVYSPTHRYAGTLDRFGRVQGTSAVVDLKTGSSLYPSTGPQLAAYKNATPGAPPLTNRIAVQLKGDGNYVVKTYTDRTDWPVFLSLLTLRNWCAQHSITPNFKEQPHV